MTGDARTIRSVFSHQRPIDRPIEKVIDYSRDDEQRLLTEISEYEVTDNVQRGIQLFLDKYGEGVRGTPINEIAIWVSGFYGSGKSSFTKYLGFALDPNRTLEGKPFVDVFAERIPDISVRQELRSLAKQHATAVIMLDLGSEQMESSATDVVTKVLHRKVLTWAGYSQIPKLVELELRLEGDGRYEEFKQAYRDRFDAEWESQHNNPLTAITRADQLVTSFYPDMFPNEGDLRKLQFTRDITVREQAEEMLQIIKRKSGHDNVLFIIDEVGQYVAPRQELILNLDGLARNLKELGNGHAWIMATGQQTLAEIVEKAAYNSTELNKLRDRFPISIELDAADIRVITHRRLLRKSSEGEQALRQMFQQHGQALVTHTGLHDARMYQDRVSSDSFASLYPFLPTHFDVLLKLISSLARASGGLGLRSAIRVIQDVLVDATGVLPAGETKLADQPLGTLATADRFYDTLRNDIRKVAAHTVSGVERIQQAFPDNELAVRVGKTIAVLQQLDGIPRTPTNIAALLYDQIGDSSDVTAVEGIVTELVSATEIGLIDDPQGGGLTFLNETVSSLRAGREDYQPTSAETARKRSEMLKSVFSPLPAVMLDGSKRVQAGVRFGSQPIDGESADVQFQVESTTESSWQERLTDFLTRTTGGSGEWANTIVWLMRMPDALDDVLRNIVRSEHVLLENRGEEADAAVAQFIRSEGRRVETLEEEARKLYRDALMDGALIFQGRQKPARSANTADITQAARAQLQEAASEVFPKFHLVHIRPSTDLATKFLQVDRLDRMPADTDPLGLVSHAGSQSIIDVKHAALQETLSALDSLMERSGTSSIQGSVLQDTLAAAPYGWSKDSVRYLVAALLMAGEISLATSAGKVEGAGPNAVNALKNTQAFNKVGVSRRDNKPSMPQLANASRRLTQLTGKQIMPLENVIQKEARDRIPGMLEPLEALQYQLQSLGLAGADRAQRLIAQGRQIQGSDGAEAINILGGDSSEFIDDVNWAQRIQKALENGAEHTFKELSKLENGIATLAGLEPSIGEIWSEYASIVEEARQSESFDDVVSDLRSVCRAIRDALLNRYETEVQGYTAELGQVQSSVESARGWIRLSEDDQREIAGRATVDLPLHAAPDSVLSLLNEVLVRRLRVLNLERELLEEVQRRQPVDPTPDPDPLHRYVSVMAQVNGQPIAADISSDDDLEAWLDQLRAKIVQALRTAVLEEVEAGS